MRALPFHARRKQVNPDMVYEPAGTDISAIRAMTPKAGRVRTQEDLIIEQSMNQYMHQSANLSKSQIVGSAFATRTQTRNVAHTIYYEDDDPRAIAPFGGNTIFWELDNPTRDDQSEEETITIDRHERSSVHTHSTDLDDPRLRARALMLHELRIAKVT